jgi:hypothetical protein
MWSRQYLQQLNQIYAKDTAGQNPFLTDGSYSNVFGLQVRIQITCHRVLIFVQPNYPCCTVNHPQGFPKFVSNAFVTADNGSALVQAYLGPFVVNTTLVDTNPVSVTVDTNYPFADTITVFVIAAKPYTHYMRVPEWAKRNGKGTIAVNGGAAQTLAPNADSLQAIQVSAGTTSFVLTLPGNIELTQGVTGGVHVNRGPLLFSSDIFRTEKNLSTNPVRIAGSRFRDHSQGHEPGRSIRTPWTSRWIIRQATTLQSIRALLRFITSSRHRFRAQSSRARCLRTRSPRLGVRSHGETTAQA